MRLLFWTLELFPQALPIQGEAVTDARPTILSHHILLRDSRSFLLNIGYTFTPFSRQYAASFCVPVTRLFFMTAPCFLFSEPTASFDPQRMSYTPSSATSARFVFSSARRTLMVELTLPSWPQALPQPKFTLFPDKIGSSGLSQASRSFYFFIMSFSIPWRAFRNSVYPLMGFR